MANNIYAALQNATAKAEKYDIQAFEVVILTAEGKVMRMCANRTAIAAKLKPEHRNGDAPFSFVDLINQYRKG